MRFIGYEVFPVANPEPRIGGPVWMFVRLDAEGGPSGYGEIFTSAMTMRPLDLAAQAAHFIEDFVLGREVHALESLRQDVLNSHYSRTPDGAKSAILSGVDIAGWDLLGKAYGVPAHHLLGGAMRPDVRMYGYLDPPPGMEPEQLWAEPELAGKRAAEMIAEGFTAVKFDPIPLLTGGSSLASQVIPVQPTRWLLDRAAATVGSVRDVLGERDLIVGTHGQFSVAGAIRVARVLESADPLWFEEPVPPGRALDLARVARATSIPIAAGERLSALSQFTELVAADAVAVLNPDLSLIGGLTEARRLAALAEAHGVQISPHVYGGPIVAAASMHLAVAVPNFLIMEGNGRYDGAHAELLTHPLRWDTGRLVPSDRPGLGHDLDERVARSWAADGRSRFMSAMPARHDPAVRPR